MYAGIGSLWSNLIIEFPLKNFRHSPLTKIKLQSIHNLGYKISNLFFHNLNERTDDDNFIKLSPKSEEMILATTTSKSVVVSRFTAIGLQIPSGSK